MLRATAGVKPHWRKANRGTFSVSLAMIDMTWLRVIAVYVALVAAVVYLRTLVDAKRARSTSTSRLRKRRASDLLSR